MFSSSHVELVWQQRPTFATVMKPMTDARTYQDCRHSLRKTSVNAHYGYKSQACLKPVGNIPSLCLTYWSGSLTLSAV